MIEFLTAPDHYTPCHYGTSKSLVSDPEVNLTFESVLKLDDAGYKAWLEKIRTTVLDLWDNYDMPPRVGLNDWDMKSAWASMKRAAEEKSPWIKDDEGADAILPVPGGVGAVNQWFPTMMKTPIQKGSRDNAISIYDMFAKQKIWERYCKTYAHRHFQRDSFFHYSHSIEVGEEVPTTGARPETALGFIDEIRNHPHDESVVTLDGSVPVSYGLLLVPDTRKEYTGFNQGFKDKKFFRVTHEEAVKLRDSGYYPEHWFRGMTDRYKADQYFIRIYDSNIRIFPNGYKSFRISISQFASNFPPLIAHAIYSKFTKGIENPIIWDPSSGWAGRITGALLAGVKYIGCDPNTDHLWTDSNGVVHSKYTEIAAYYDELYKLDGQKSDVLFFPCGSEVMRDQPEFQKYKGKLDLVFTSPPYFARELYSDDPTQSAIKFSQFDDWCEGFLKPTIRTAAEWLKPGGYFLWNIADATFDGKMLPIEGKSIEYAKQFGLVQEPTVKMLLTSMPGQNRVKADGSGGTMKNSTKVNGKISKFEPVFVFRRPERLADLLKKPYA